MEKAELPHFEKVEAIDHKQQKELQIDSHEQALVDTASHAAIQVSTENTSTNNTPTSTPYTATTVYLTGMPIRYCTESVVEKMMSRYGTIVRCTVHTHQSNKKFAFCEFMEPSSATEAIRALNGRKLGGQYLLVRPAFKESNSSTVTSSMTSNENLNNPKRQRQQIDFKIEAIKRKLAKQS